MFKVTAACIVALFAARVVCSTTVGVTCRLSTRRAIRQFPKDRP